MFCNKCGAQLPDDAKFCNKCGNSLGEGIEDSQLPVDHVPESSGHSDARTDLPSRVGKRRRLPMVILIACICIGLIAAFVFWGLSAGWFWSANKGVWVPTRYYLTNNEYKAQETDVWQVEYDDSGRIASMTKYATDSGSPESVEYIETYSYDDSDPNRTTCSVVRERLKNGQRKMAYEKRIVQELGPGGRVLTEKSWKSDYDGFKDGDLSDDSALVKKYSYSFFGTIAAIDYVNSSDGEHTWNCKRDEYDSRGYLAKRFYPDIEEPDVFDVSCSSDGRPVELTCTTYRTGEPQTINLESDESGNITRLGGSDHFEYAFVANPKGWYECNASSSVFAYV